MTDVWIAFGLTVFAGMATGIGSAIAFAARRTNYRFLSVSTGFSAGVMPPQVMGVLFAGVAGIMVYISLDELLPTSRAYGRGHDSLLGLVGGMVIMALSLLMMKSST